LVGLTHAISRMGLRGQRLYFLHLSGMRPLCQQRRVFLPTALVLVLSVRYLAWSSLAWMHPAALRQPVVAPVSRRWSLFSAASIAASASNFVSSPGEAAAVTDLRVPDFKLANGMTMPAMALNTVGLTADQTEAATSLAVSLGVRHIDFHPGRERDGVARVLASRGRDTLFLTTKIAKFKDDPPDPAAAAARARGQIEDDLGALGVQSVDMLLLRDSPSCEVMQAQWAVLEEALASGKTQRIGVINYCEKSLNCLLRAARVTPAVHYFMLHAGMGPDAHGLRSFGEARGIKTFAYGALGEPGPERELFDSPILKRIAAANGRSVPQVALRWVAQSGAAYSVRPTTAYGLGKSACDEPSCRAGLEERAQTFSWSLTPEEMAEINAMTSPDGNPTLFSSPGCKGCYGCK